MELVTFELFADYLLIEGHGVRNSDAEMFQTATAVYNKIVETESRYLLIDYRKVHLNLNHVQAFNLIRTYESNMPQLHQVTAVCVFNNESENFASYWQYIGRQRGFDIVIFKTLEEAKQWLTNKIRTDKEQKPR